MSSHWIEPKQEFIHDAWQTKLISTLKIDQISSYYHKKTGTNLANLSGEKNVKMICSFFNYHWETLDQLTKNATPDDELDILEKAKMNRFFLSFTFFCSYRFQYEPILSVLKKTKPLKLNDAL